MGGKEPNQTNKYHSCFDCTTRVLHTSTSKPSLSQNEVSALKHSVKLFGFREAPLTFFETDQGLNCLHSLSADDCKAGIINEKTHPARNYGLLFMSATYIQVHFRLNFMEANTMNPYQTAPWGSLIWVYIVPNTGYLRT